MQIPVVKSIDWPSASVTIAFFMSEPLARAPLEPLGLALLRERVHRLAP